MALDTSLPITPKDVLNFKNAYQQHFGMELDGDTAKRKLTQLVRLVELVYKPASEQEAIQ